MVSLHERGSTAPEVGQNEDLFEIRSQGRNTSRKGLEPLAQMVASRDLGRGRQVLAKR